MLKPKFTLDSKGRLYITSKYITNGHWMVTRKAAEDLKPLSKLLTLTTGTYYGKEYISSKEHNFDHLVPSPDGYHRLSQEPHRCIVKNDMVISYVFKILATDVEIAINPNYLPILRLGIPYAKNNSSPIRVTDSNDEFIALLMPMRLT